MRYRMHTTAVFSTPEKHGRVGMKTKRVSPVLRGLVPLASRSHPEIDAAVKKVTGLEGKLLPCAETPPSFPEVSYTLFQRLPFTHSDGYSPLIERYQPAKITYERLYRDADSGVFDSNAGESTASPSASRSQETPEEMVQTLQANALFRYSRHVSPREKERFRIWQEFNKVLLFFYHAVSPVRTDDVDYGSEVSMFRA